MDKFSFVPLIIIFTQRFLTHIMKPFFTCILILFEGIVLSNANAQEFQQMEESIRIDRLIPPTGKIQAVLDTDTYNEIDDQFALVYALLSPEKIDLKAVYAAPFSNNRAANPKEGMEKSYEEILRILDKMDISPEGFAYKGSTSYLEDPNQPESSQATEDLIKRAKEANPEQPLYVIAVGAITNIANAILLEPSIIHNIVVVWLGGNGHNWGNQREFNYFQDLNASRTLFDCGAPVVQYPCTPVVTHLSTTVPEMEANVGGRGAIGDYLLEIFKDYHSNHFGWSKVLWDMAAISYVIDPSWSPSNLVHSPIVTDEFTYSFDDSRHFIRMVYFIHRDPVFRDFFTKLDNYSKK